MSANLVVDLAQTCDYFCSLQVVSGQAIAVGNICDLLGANTYTQVYCAGANSGPLQLLIQTSDDTVSGNFTDPTSGYAAFPVNIISGGVFWVNSGLWNSGFMSPAPSLGISGAPLFASGGIWFGAFQRPQRYARLLAMSGNLSIQGVPFNAGFIGNKKTTGSGFGFTMSPTSGTPFV